MMTSRSTITELVAAAALLAGCDSPDITIKGTRSELNQSLSITLCPVGTPVDSPDCADTVDLFGTTSDYTRTADIFVGDSETSVTAYLESLNANCVSVAITLEGEVNVDFAVGSDVARCTPVASCISAVLDDQTCD